MTIRQVRASDVAERLKRGDALVLLDVREPDELALCRIDGARHIPLGDLPQRFSQLDPEHEIIVFCHHGKRSLMAANFLHQQGYPNVASMTGGIEAWSLEVDPRVPRY